MLDIIGIGSTFVDYFFDADNKILNKYNLRPEDDFLFSEKNISPIDIFENLSLLSKSPGGISVNTIVVLGALGVNVSYCGVIGKDKDGNYFFNNLKRVDKHHLIKSGTMGRCACLLSHNRRYRTFLSQVNPRDNDFFKNVDYNYLNNSKVIHVSSFLLNPEKNLKNLNKIFKKIKNPLISFSPSIAYVNLGLKAILPLLEKTHVIFLNEQEIKKLINKNPKDASKYLLTYGVKIVACTMGAKGVLITSGKEQFFSPSPKVKKVIDTTGAGDAFAAGFLYGLIKNKSLKWSAKFANKIASKSVSDFGLNWLRNINVKD
ncbi:MAG: adenosine kinase [Candidatus Levybacteria bacterium]|nr:adenosine kinase [Candidatus Levybacteria bacterium]MBI3069711.1 adenosine kinase [Candidatus Levybacteria bacterium]